MSRIARIVGAGYPHHIIQRGNNKQRLFFDDSDRELYLKLLKKYSSESGCKIYAYSLMDNHVHILCIPLYEHSLAKTMQKLSLSFTQHINRKYNRTGRLWECRFHSAMVDKEAYLWSVCRYIERNPVRAHIVNEPSKYKWSSAHLTTMEQKEGFVEPIWQNNNEKKEYLAFLLQPDNEDELEKMRRATYTGKPIGTESFLNSITKSLGIKLSIRPRGRPPKIKK